MLNKKGEIADRCGTPAVAVLTVDALPFQLDLEYRLAEIRMDESEHCLGDAGAVHLQEQSLVEAFSDLLSNAQHLVGGAVLPGEPVDSSGWCRGRQFSPVVF
ncbi:hypothetical protein Trydic_g9847 [Trypoxylus dichotomus]